MFNLYRILCVCNVWCRWTWGNNPVPSTTYVQLVDNSMRLLYVMLFSSNSSWSPFKHLCLTVCTCVFCAGASTDVTLSGTCNDRTLHLGGPWNIWKRAKQLSGMSTIRIERDVDVNEKIQNTFLTCHWWKMKLVQQIKQKISMMMVFMKMRKPFSIWRSPVNPN